MFSQNFKIRKISEKNHRPRTFSVLKFFTLNFFSGLLLQSILSTFPKTFISTRASEIVHILAISDNDGVTKGQLFRLLGIKLAKCAPPEDQRLAVLNEAWKAMNTLTHASEYIHCVEPWAEYISQHFGVAIQHFGVNILSVYNT